MWKWFVGPVLAGTGYVAGSVYGRDSEQLVHKSPEATYAAVEQALDNIPESGTTSFEGGTPMPYTLSVDRTPGQRLVVNLAFAGRQGADAEMEFTPEDGGRATLIATRIHGDRAVLSSALAGTSRARLAYAPDWALNLAVRPLLAQVAQQIEQGEMAAFTGPTSQGEAEAQWEQNLSADQQGQVQQWRQYDATRPTTDLDGGSSGG
jgi:hypothetical protein